MQRVAVVAGATGLTGSLCADRLLATGAYASVTPIVRRPAGRRGERVVDFDHIASLELPAGSDVFCALGTTIRKAGSREQFRKVDLEYPVALAQRALACGARQFLIVSSVGASASSSNFYLRTKGETEQAILALPFFAVHVFRPSLLIGKRAESRPAERLAIALAPAFRFALIGPARRYRPVKAETVAAAMAVAALAGAEGPQLYEYDAICALAHEAIAKRVAR